MEDQIALISSATELTEDAAAALLADFGDDVGAALDAFFAGDVTRADLEGEGGRRAHGTTPACQYFWNGYCRDGDACPLRHTAADTVTHYALEGESTESQIDPSQLFTRDPSDMTYDELLSLGDSMGSVAVFVHPSTRSRLTTITIETATHDPCAICCEVLDVKEEATVLPCGHSFHSPCVGQWMDGHNLCPMCKAEIVIRVPEKTPIGKREAPFAKVKVKVKGEGSEDGRVAGKVVSVRPRGTKVAMLKKLFDRGGK